MARQPIDATLRHEIESIFEEAVELPRAERVRFLAARCGADHRLREEVDALIGAHERTAGVLEGNGAAAAAGAIRTAAVTSARTACFASSVEAEWGSSTSRSGTTASTGSGSR